MEDGLKYVFSKFKLLGGKPICWKPHNEVYAMRQFTAAKNTRRMDPIKMAWYYAPEVHTSPLITF